MGSHESAAAAMVALRRVIRFVRLADREAQSAHGLSAAQLFVLTSLDDSPAHSLAELAERSLTDQSSVSTVVAKLVERKLISRRAATSDRRRSELRLTPAGERVVRTAPRTPQERMITAIGAMPAPKRAELVRALESLASAIGANELQPRMLFEDEPPPLREVRASRAPRSRRVTATP